jgi:hypothetical protein
MRGATGAVWSALVSGSIESETVFSSGVPQVASLRKYTELNDSQTSMLLKELDSYKREHHLTVQIPTEILSTSRYFSATFATNSSSQIAQVLIEILPNYPWSAPKFWVIGSKLFPAKDVALMHSVLPSIDQTPSTDFPERLVNRTLAWIRECFNVYQDTLKEGSSSRYTASEQRYDPSTWSTTS